MTKGGGVGLVCVLYRITKFAESDVVEFEEEEPKGKRSKSSESSDV